MTYHPYFVGTTADLEATDFDMKMKRIISPVIVLLLGVSANVTAQDAQPGIAVEGCPSASGEQVNHMTFAPESWFTGDRRSPEEYRQRIQRIESDNGVFSYDLVPELVGLGLIRHEQADFNESSELLERALYVVRANDGLYSIRQLVLIDLLIASKSGRGDWKGVADLYDMMYWLYRRNFSEDDPRQLHSLKRLRRWYIESYNKETKRSLEELFRNSEEIYERAIKIMWKCTGGDSRQTMCFWHKACCIDGDPRQGMCPLDHELFGN